MDQEVLDARAKLAARFGKVQVGGKGRSSFDVIEENHVEIYS